MKKVFKIIGLITVYALPLSIALTYFDVSYAMGYLLGLHISKHIAAIWQD